MLPKSQKIPRSLFKNILNRKKCAFSTIFSLCFDKGKPSTPPRFSFVVSKKIAKQAVVRNKLRRRGYSFLQKNKKNIQPSFVVVFFLKKGAEKLSAPAFGAEITLLLKKIGAWKQNNDSEKSNH